MTTTLTPEEKFNKEVFYVLKRIHERSLYTKSNEPIDYWVNFNFYDATGSSPSAGDEASILEKLEEWGVIRIINSGWEYE